MPRVEGLVKEVGKKGKIVYGSNNIGWHSAAFDGMPDLGIGDLVTFNLQGDRALNVKLKQKKLQPRWR